MFHPDCLVFSLVAAGVLGNFTGYWFGYRTGPVLFNRPDSFFFKKRYIVVAEEFYRQAWRHGIDLGRFFPIIRTFAPIFAGVVKVDLKKVYPLQLNWQYNLGLYLYLIRILLGRRYPQMKFYVQYIVNRVDNNYNNSSHYCLFLKAGW